MKRIYIIGGTMGIGKTTVCHKLKLQLYNSVFLDGDWCWDSNPFQVNENTKKMVIDNICYLLNNFIRCDAYENIIFCWVMHQQAIIDDILAKIHTAGCEVKIISLVCSEEALRERMTKDIHAGIRNPDTLEKSISRLPLYDDLRTIKIDVSNLKPDDVVNYIMNL